MLNWSSREYSQVRNGFFIIVIAALLITMIYDWAAVPALKSQFNILQQKYSRVESFILATEKYNYPALVAISNQKNISQDDFTNAIYVLENEPYSAESYLTTKLNFSADEVKSVLNNPVTVNQPTTSQTVTTTSQTVKSGK